MGRMFSFEMRRFWKSKKNWMVFAMVFPILLGFIYINDHQDELYQKWFTTQIILERNLSKGEIQELESSIRSLQEDKQEQEKDETEIMQIIQGYEKRLETQRHWFATSVNILAYMRSPAKRLTNEIARDELLLKLHENKEIEINTYLYGTVAPESVYKDLKVKYHLQENEITPLTSPYEMTGHNFISRMFSYPGFLIWLVIAIAYSVEVFSLDMTCGTYKTIYTSTSNRSRICIAKWLCSLVNLLATFAVYTLGFAAYFYLKGDFGNMSYPVIFGSLGIVPWYSAIILYQLPMALLTLVILVTLIQFVDMALKDPSETFVVIGGIFLFDFIIRDFISENSKFWQMYPLSGLDIQRVFLYGESVNKWWLTQVVLTLAILLLGTVALTKFRREDL